MGNPFKIINTRLTNIETLLLDIQRLLQVKNEPIPIPEADQYVGIAEAAKIIGLSVPTIYGLVHRSAIPHYKRGKKLYFSTQDLTDWIKSGRRKTTVEIANEVDTYISKSRK